MKLTKAQRAALDLFRTKRWLVSGGGGFHGASGSALSALERRGLVKGSFNALVGTMTWDITEAGRAALENS